MQPVEAIQERIDDGQIIVLLQDEFNEPHERVRTTFEDCDALELYAHHCMSAADRENARVELHELRS